MRSAGLAIVTAAAAFSLLARSAHADSKPVTPPAQKAEPARKGEPAQKAAAPAQGRTPVDPAATRSAPPRSTSRDVPPARSGLADEPQRRTERPGDRRDSRPFVDRDGDGLNDGAEGRFRFRGRDRGRPGGTPGGPPGGPPRGRDGGREGGRERPGGRRGG